MGCFCDLEVNEVLGREIDPCQRALTCLFDMLLDKVLFKYMTEVSYRSICILPCFRAYNRILERVAR
jgi:hypothetical protein